MALEHGDLRDTVLSKISIDEFEPKTGDVQDVLVFGFYSIEEGAAKDLYSFLNSSVFEIRDVEVSPNPNSDGQYMLFIEVDRNADVLDTIDGIVKDIENATGKLKWKASTHLTDDYYPLGSDELAEVVITDPENYMTRDEYDAQQAEQARVQAEESRLAEEAELADSNSQAVLDFLRDSSLVEAGFSDTGLLTMMGKQGIAQFEVLAFGDADTALAEAGIDQAPIVESDYNTRIFNGMLGDLNAVKIAEYVVVFNTNTKQALVGKPC